MDVEFVQERASSSQVLRRKFSFVARTASNELNRSSKG